MNNVFNQIKIKNSKNIIKLITFDITGTLIKFRTNPIDVYYEKGREFGLNLEKEELKYNFKNVWKNMNETHPNFGNDWRNWWQKFVIDVYQKSSPKADKMLLIKISNDLIEEFSSPNLYELAPGALDLLKYLKRPEESEDRRFSELRLGVISNFDSRIRKVIEYYKLDKYLDLTLLSHEIQLSKPDPKIFEKAINICNEKFTLGVRNENCLHIGDNKVLDYEASSRLGWISFLLDYNVNETYQNHNSSNQYQFKNLNSVKKFFELNES